LVKRLRATTYIVTCLTVILSAASAGAVQKRRFSGNAEARPYTRDMPAVEKVELLKLKKRGDLWDGETEASKVVGGAEAQEIAALWRSQTYLPHSAVCHNPGYAIKFYSGGRLLVYASLCWECDNIGFLTPALGKTQGFGGRDKKGRQLLQVFKAAFPEAEEAETQAESPHLRKTPVKDAPWGMTLLAGYEHEGEVDFEGTFSGKIWKRGGLEIHYVIGQLFGQIVRPEDKGSYLRYWEEIVGGRVVRFAHLKNKELVISFPLEDAPHTISGANFSTRAERPEDAADMVTMALSMIERKPAER
jgi:hypothetical protein